MKPYFETELGRLWHGDCKNILPNISYADLILTDPPYGTTACKWDNVIPFDKMWERLNKLSNPTTPILLFSSMPFNYLLVNSNIKDYKYD